MYAFDHEIDFIVRLTGEAAHCGLNDCDFPFGFVWRSFSQCNFTGANLSSVNAQGTDFSSCMMSKAN
jgi:Pentapeptide repeats (8 copies).